MAPRGRGSKVLQVKALELPHGINKMGKVKKRRAELRKEGKLADVIDEIVEYRMDGSTLAVQKTNGDVQKSQLLFLALIFILKIPLGVIPLPLPLLLRPYTSPPYSPAPSQALLPLDFLAILGWGATPFPLVRLPLLGGGGGGGGRGGFFFMEFRRCLMF